MSGMAASRTPRTKEGFLNAFSLPYPIGDSRRSLKVFSLQNLPNFTSHRTRGDQRFLFDTPCQGFYASRLIAF